MSTNPETCARCGTALDHAALDGLCPRCVALDMFTPPAASAPAAGEHLRYFGDYELHELIARGGMGLVYKARQTSLDRVVAVKLIAGGLLADTQAVERFKTEATAAASLQHPNIVAIHEIGEHAGQHYFSMDYVAGATLGALVREGPLPACRAAEYVRRAAGAVHYAHDRGVLHRDLKPSNVLIDEHDQPRVTDFGLAKRLDADSTLTSADAVLGTPAFMPPEQADRNHGAVGVRSDVYGLGAILYHLVTGRAPFTGASPAEILAQVLNREPVAPRLLNPSVPRDLETICLKCLEKESSRRYASATELADDLGRFLRDEPIRARPVSAAEHAWRWCKRRPALAAALAGIVVLLVGIAVTSSLAARRIDGLRREALTNLYASDMRLAQQAIAEDKFGVAMGLLERHLPRRGEPDLRGFEWRHFYDQCRSDEVATLGRHADQAQRAAFSPDGRLVATGARDIRVWDAATHQLRLTLTNEGFIRALAFSPDSRRLAAADSDGLLRCVEMETRREVARRATTNQMPFALQWSTNSPQVLFWAPGRCATWDVVTGELREHGPLPVASSRAVVSDNGLLVSINRPLGRLEVWRSNDLVAGWPLAGLALAAAGSPNGRWFAAGEYSGVLNLFELAPTARTNRFQAHRGLINALAFAPDGQRVASGGADQVIRVWYAETGRQLAELRGHRRALWALAFSPDGDWLVSGDMSGEVKLWHTRTNRHEAATVAGFSATLSEDGAVWTLANTNGVWLVHAASPDEPGLKVPAKLVSWPSGGVPSTNGGIWRGTDGALTLFGSDLRPRAVKLPPVLTNSVMFLSPDGRFLIHTRPETKAVAAWDFVAARQVWALPPDDDGLRLLAISRDSQRIALGDFAGRLRVLELPTGREIQSLAAHRAATYAADFSPDGARLVTAGLDGAVKLWEIATGRLLAELRSTVESFWTVALSPDGRRIAAGTSESTIVLWDVPSRQEVATLPLGGTLGPVQGLLRFSPDGTALLLGNTGPLRRWPAPPLAAKP